MVAHDFCFERHPEVPPRGYHDIIIGCFKQDIVVLSSGNCIAKPGDPGPVLVETFFQPGADREIISQSAHVGVEDDVVARGQLPRKPE